MDTIKLNKLFNSIKANVQETCESLIFQTEIDADKKADTFEFIVDGKENIFVRCEVSFSTDVKITEATRENEAECCGTTWWCVDSVEIYLDDEFVGTICPVAMNGKFNF